MGKPKRLRKERKKRKQARAAADSYVYRLANNLGVNPKELKTLGKPLALSEIIEATKSLIELLKR